MLAELLEMSGMQVLVLGLGHAHGSGLLGL